MLHEFCHGGLFAFVREFIIHGRERPHATSLAFCLLPSVGRHAALLPLQWHSYQGMFVSRSLQTTTAGIYLEKKHMVPAVDNTKLILTSLCSPATPAILTTPDMSDEILLLSPRGLADNDDSGITSDYDASEDDMDASVRLPSPTFSSFELEDEFQFPLMKLCPEVRLNVYDCLFTDLTINRHRQVANLTVYHHPHEWPDNDFSAYRNLLLTCKEVHDEAKSLWENMYIRHCCFYFWKMPGIYRIAKLLTDLGEPYQRMRYVLRTRTFEEIGSHEIDLADDDAVELMTKRRGFPCHDEDYAHLHWAWPTFHWPGGPGIHALLANGRIPHEIYYTGVGAEFRICARADLPGLEECSLAVHECVPSSSPAQTQYLIMSGKMGAVCWDGYDPPAAHACLMIWEEWRRRGYPSGCLAKSDVVFAWRAQAMSGQDEAWLALGGNSAVDLNDLVNFPYVDRLNYWLRTWE